MYIIALVDEGFLQLSTCVSSEEKMKEIVRKWFNSNHSYSNDEGYVAVEYSEKEGETAERMFQVNLDEEPEEFESYFGS